MLNAGCMLSRMEHSRIVYFLCILEALAFYANINSNACSDRF